MAILLRWTVPESDELDYTHTKIERSTSETGTYTEIASQLISDNTYVDEEGTTSSWYKLRFYNSVSGNYTDYSDPMQGGTYSGLCSLSQIRLVSGLSTTEISDTDLFDLILLAQREILSKVNVRVIRERVEYIDSTRENNVNGTNTTFYVKNWLGKFLADTNLDGTVDTSDLEVFAVDSNGTETELTLSSIDITQGKFVLSSAPSSSLTLYVSYSWSSYDQTTPDNLLNLAAIYLVSAYAFLQKDSGIDAQVQFGNVRINELASQSYSVFYKRYLELLAQLNRSTNSKGQWRESYVRI
jgi:hypothetical protein